jgi:hypothetical protein
MISAEDFVRRFESLIQGGVGPGIPRRGQDAHILLKAVMLGLPPNFPCSESDLGQALRGWLDSAGPRFDIDPVTLRRALVDYRYLRRDPAGRAYDVEAISPVSFAPEVEALNPLELISEMRERALIRAAARRAELQGEQPNPA